MKINKRVLIKLFAIIFIPAIFYSCGGDAIPKPKGYIRFDLPEHTYELYEDECPYAFEIGTYAKVISRERSEHCWKNVYVKPSKATIHISYKPIENNFGLLVEDAHELVYGHTVKADAITEQVFLNPEKMVYGILYEIKGDAASNLQFIATDSVNHFLRGALYFRATPNQDSLAPLVRFMRKDIEHLIETINWK
jgi:gliding motility-associated lipoprotein GldD